MSHIVQAIDRLISYQELGKTDARHLLSLVPLLDADGCVERSVLIRALYPGAKDPDASYRNFVRRLKAAIEGIVERLGDEAPQDKALLRSIEITNLRATRRLPARLRISVAYRGAYVPPAANRHYDPHNYVSSNGADTRAEPVPGEAIRLFLSYSTENKTEIYHFKALLEPALGELEAAWDRPIRIWEMADLLPNDRFDDQIRAQMSDADYGLAALSQAYLRSDYITKVELNYLLDSRKIVLFGLDSRIDGRQRTSAEFFATVAREVDGDPVLVQALQQQVVYLTDRQGDFFNVCAEPKAQQDFIRAFIDKFKQLVEHDREQQRADRPQEAAPCHLGEEGFKATGDRRYREIEYVHAYARDVDLGNRAERLGRLAGREPDAETDDRRPSVGMLDDMLHWVAEGREAIYAVLGDYGMGKTFSCRMFADRLMEERRQRPELPLPLYLDLREVDTFIEADNIRRQPYLGEMLGQVLRRHSVSESAEKVLELTRQGGLVVIFDGLDEKLVHYTNEMRDHFLSELMRVFPDDLSRDRSQVKTVVSCRTHHFESLTSQASFLTGLGRSDSRGSDYRAVEILPFNTAQMRLLLDRLLGERDAAQVFGFIQGHAYLAEIGRRPYLLSQLAAALPQLHALRERAIPLNTASVYQALITDTFQRDEHKHVLQLRHKQRMLQDLAARFWERGEQTLDIDDLNDWYQGWLRRDPDLYGQYREAGSQQLEKDLRNSSLLLRFGEDEFGFTHSSMQEYFLARWLLRRWQREQGGFRLERPISRLTGRFVCDSLVLLKARELNQLHQALIAYGSQADPGEHGPDQDRLLLEIVTALADAGKAPPEFPALYLFGLHAPSLRLRGLRAERLVLQGCELPEGRWQQARIGRLELTGSNIGRSSWQDCRVEALAGDGPAEGATLMDSRLPAGIGADAHAYGLATGAKNSTSHPPTPPDNTPGLAAIQHGHQGMVTSVAFSPDGRHLASASQDHTLKLWNRQGQCLLTGQGHSSAVTSVAFSPDGQHLASASADNTLKLWNRQGQCLLTCQGHLKPVLSVAFSPNGRHLASASEDNTLKLWNHQGQCLLTCQGHSNWVMSVAFSPDGQHLASASLDKTVKVWNHQGQCLLTCQGHSSGLKSVAFSPDGQHLASASQGGTVKLWNRQGQCLLTCQGHSNGVTSVAFSPDGQLLASASDDHTVKLWNRQGQCLLTCQGHSNGVTSVAFSPDGRHLASTSFGNFKLWNRRGQCLLTCQGHSLPVVSVAFSPDGQHLASASWDHTLNLWNRQGQCLLTCQGHSSGVDSVAFSPDGQHLASASIDRIVKLWNRQGQCLLTCQGHSNSVRSVAFSPDGRHLASASHDRTVKLWNRQGQCLLTCKGHSSGVNSVAFSPDGQHLASASQGGTVKLWNRQGQCLLTCQGHSRAVNSVAFSPDDQHLASASTDNTVKLWNRQGQCLLTCQGHSDGVWSVAFSPDGQHLASASLDRTVKLWNRQGQCLLTCQGHSNWVMSVAFSPDGRHLLSTGMDGLILWWSLDCARPVRIMSAPTYAQWWSADLDPDGAIETLHGTELAWQRLNYAQGDRVWPIDAFDSFVLHPSRDCLEAAGPER